MRRLRSPRRPVAQEGSGDVSERGKLQIAVLSFNAVLYLATGYAVFVLDASGWWFALTVAATASISESTTP